MNHSVRIYGFSGSHPCEAAYAAARYKRIEFEAVEVPPALHRLIMPLKFGGSRVPGAVIDGRKVQGTTAIFHALDAAEPDPPLFPRDPDLRRAVEKAERWGEGEMQDIGRRLIWAHLSRSPETLAAWAERTPPGFSRRMKLRAGPQIAAIAKRGNGASDEAVRSDLAILPVFLDEADRLIADGVIGGDHPNAADFQILSTIGLWCHLQDLRGPLIARPCGRRAVALFPNYDGAIPGGLLPAAWFQPVWSAAELAAAAN